MFMEVKSSGEVFDWIMTVLVSTCHVYIYFFLANLFESYKHGHCVQYILGDLVDRYYNLDYMHRIGI